MDIQLKKVKSKLKSNPYIVFTLLIFISMSAGCATTHKTTTTETTVEYANKTTQVAKDNQDKTPVEKSTTTATSTETKPQHTGIIGGLFHVIGSVIAFPFIVIGGLLRMIF